MAANKICNRIFSNFHAQVKLNTIWKSSGLTSHFTAAYFRMCQDAVTSLFGMFTVATEHTYYNTQWYSRVTLSLKHCFSASFKIFPTNLLSELICYLVDLELGLFWQAVKVFKYQVVWNQRKQVTRRRNICEKNNTSSCYYQKLCPVSGLIAAS